MEDDGSRDASTMVRSGFPYEPITYHIDNTFMSHELIGRMPLPHRLGSTLYTQKDLMEVKISTLDESATTSMISIAGLDKAVLFNRLYYTRHPMITMM